MEGVKLADGFELVGSEAVKEAVAEGLGVAFLSRLAVDREVRASFLAVTGVNAWGLSRPLTLLRLPVNILSRQPGAALGPHGRSRLRADLYTSLP
ncbi:MAG: LysR substrate-binding domain-containing protein [Rubrobacteraceae bacterium]